eukprot:Rmarinus@m.20231
MLLFFACLFASMFPGIPAESLEVTFSMQVDYWYWEASWNVFHIESNTKLFTTNQLFSYEEEKTTQSVFLEPGSYNLLRWDDYGDGGISGSIYLADDDTELLVFSADDYGDQSSLYFTVPEIFNECDGAMHNCHQWALCIDTLSSFKCECQCGYVGDGVSCGEVSSCTPSDACGYGAVRCGVDICLCDAGFYG